MSSFRLKWLLTCCYIDDFVVYIKKISIHGHLFNCVTLNAPYSNTFTWNYSLHTFYLSCPPPSRYLYIVYIVATGKSIGNVCSRLSTNLLAIHVTISHTYTHIYVCCTDPRISHCQGELHRTRNKRSITFHFQLVQFSAESQNFRHCVKNCSSGVFRERNRLWLLSKHGLHRKHTHTHTHTEGHTQGE